MNKPGEYVLHEATQEQLSSIDNELYLEIKRFRDDTVSAVEKAHAERNCGNCEFSAFNFPYTTCERHKFRPPFHTIKCNDWKSKEADNADA